MITQRHNPAYRSAHFVLVKYGYDEDSKLNIVRFSKSQKKEVDEGFRHQHDFYDIKVTEKMHCPL